MHQLFKAGELPNMGSGVVLELPSADYDEMVRETITPLINAFIDDFVFQAQMTRGRYDTVHLDRILPWFLALVNWIVSPEVVREVFAFLSSEPRIQ